MVHDASFSPDSQHIVTASSDGHVRVWPIPVREPLALHRAGGVVVEEFSADGRRVLAREGIGNAVVWTPGDAREPLVVKHTLADRPPALSRDGLHVLTVTGTTVTVTPVAGNATARRLTHEHEVHEAVFDGAGTRVLTVSEKARVWPLAGGGPTVLEHPPRVQQAVFHPDGRLLTVGAAGTMRLWTSDGTSSEEVARLDDGQNDSFKTVVLDGAGDRVLTVPYRGVARVWDVARPHLSQQLGSASVDSAQFSPDGRCVLGIVYDSREARLWCEGAAAVVLPFRDVRQATFRLDGASIAVLHAGGASLWSPTAANEVVPIRVAGMADGVEFSRDGQWLLVTARLAEESNSVVGGTTVHVFRASDLFAVAVLPHREPIGSVSISPDGTRIATGEGSSARVWSLDWPDLRSLLSSATASCLIATDRVEFLGETQAAARAAWLQCERQNGRSTR